MNSNATLQPRPSFWSRCKPNIIPLAVCLGFILVSVWQTTYFRADLRKMMLETGRRVKYQLNSDKKDWLFDSKLLFDGDTETAVRIPFSNAKDGDQAQLTIELALSHFPDPENTQIGIPRKPVFIEVINGPCRNCSLTEFRQKTRIKTASLEMRLRPLRLPMLSFVVPNEVTIWKTKLTFPDAPISRKINLKSTSIFPAASKVSREIYTILLDIRVHSVYEGSTPEKPGVFISEIRYADQSLQGKSDVHHWH